jgi:hypothetical protein
MKREQYEPLTPEELKAVKSFAAYAGRCWKQELRYAWMSASLPGHLHKLRNSHGPSWLNSFKLEEEKVDHNMSSAQMVANASPTVCRFRVTFYGPAQAEKTVHYWTGTRAQVMGWADQEGRRNSRTEWTIRRDKGGN